MSTEKVEGRNVGSIRMYTLSTCIWCKKTKQFLADNGIGYEYTDLDMLEGEERTAAVEELKKWNEKCSLPTMVVNDEKCIVGFKEDEIKEALGL